MLNLNKPAIRAARVCLTALLFFATPLSRYHRAVASPETPPGSVRISQKQVGALEEALTAVSLQAKVTFVVEGVPLHPRLSDEDSRKALLRISNPSANAPVGTADASAVAPLLAVVTGLADAYDYRVSRLGNVYILNKRFSQRDDVPEVTMEEAFQSARDMHKCLSQFAPGLVSGWDDTELKQILTSLPESKIALLQNPSSGLPVSVLTASQKDILYRQSLHSFLDSKVRLMEGTIERYQQVNGSRAHIVLEKSGTTEVLGIRIFPPVLDRRAGFLPLRGGSAWATTARGVLSVNVRDLVSVSEKTPLQSNLAEPSGPAMRTVVTLAQAAERQTARLDTSALALGKPAVTVDAMLAGKRVLLIGEDMVLPLQVVRALAQVYGLTERRETRGDSEQVRLTRYRPHVLRRPSEVNEEVRRLLPAPFAPFFASYTQKENPSVRFSANPENQPGNGFRTKALMNAAASKLERSVEPRLKNSSEQGIFVSDLEPQERMALASLLMVRVIDALDGQLYREAPWFVTDLDHAVVFSATETDSGGNSLRAFRMGRRLPPVGTLLWDGPMWSQVVR